MIYKKIIIVLVVVFFSACSNKTIKTNEQEHTQLKLDNTERIGFAYMKDGTTLVSVSKEYEELKEEDIEVIAITKYGFYPDYYLSDKEENGKFITCSFASWKNKERGISKKCDSEYTTHSTGHVFANMGIMLLGDPANIQSFDKEYFFKVITDNNLINEQKKLLNLK